MMPGPPMRGRKSPRREMRTGTSGAWPSPEMSASAVGASAARTASADASANQIAGLQVAVDDRRMLRVEVTEHLEHGARDAHRLRFVVAAAARELLRERLAVDELLHEVEEGDAGALLFEVVAQLGDGRVIDAGEHGGLAAEEVDALPVAHVGERQLLDGDALAGLRVEGGEGVALAAAAEEALQPIAAAQRELGAAAGAPLRARRCGRLRAHGAERRRIYRGHRDGRRRVVVLAHGCSRNDIEEPWASKLHSGWRSPVSCWRCAARCPRSLRRLRANGAQTTSSTSGPRRRATRSVVRCALRARAG